MTSLDLSPAPAAAPAHRRVLHHGWVEARLLLRNGEQLLLALVIPVALLLVGRFLGGRFGSMDTLAPSVLALAVWSTAFTSVAIATGFERRYGVLERLAATPLGRSGLVLGKACATTWVILGQLLVLTVVSLVLGWRPDLTATSVLVAAVSLVAGVVCFASLALTLAGRLRAEITLALANLIYLLFLLVGALIIPLDRYPAALQSVITWLPTAAVGEALRDLSTGSANWLGLVVVLVWAVASAGLARKVFRWSS